MYRRTFLASLPLLLAPAVAVPHSPWGQYAVYRQKHLLILSTRDDAPTYPFSKLLVDAINAEAPTASARPARARDLKRAYDLLRSDQFQFAILSKSNADAMRSATGPFAGGEAVDLKTIYRFDDLDFIVRADFPPHLVAIVAHAILTNLATLPGALSPTEVLDHNTLHIGAGFAIADFQANDAKDQ